MKKKLIFLTFILSLVVLLLPSCADEETRPNFRFLLSYTTALTGSRQLLLH